MDNPYKVLTKSSAAIPARLFAKKMLGRYIQSRGLGMVYGAKTLGSAAGRVFTGGKWKGAERLQQSADRALEVAKRNNSVLEHQLKRHADVYGGAYKPLHAIMKHRGMGDKALTAAGFVAPMIPGVGNLVSAAIFPGYAGIYAAGNAIDGYKASTPEYKKKAKKAIEAGSADAAADAMALIQSNPGFIKSPGAFASSIIPGTATGYSALGTEELADRFRGYYTGSFKDKKYGILGNINDMLGDAGLKHHITDRARVQIQDHINKMED